MDRTYNGWANYETWAVALWLDNDEGSYLYWHERTREIARTATVLGAWDNPQSAANRELAEELKNEVTSGDAAPDLGASMYADLLGAALESVDWNEIASHWLDDLPSDAFGESVEEDA